jgi:two-component system, sensor histidine kinase PdtaS
MSAASSDTGDSVRELLLGMGGSSMRKSYYPELRSKLDDLELFRELVDRSSDAILLFSLPANRLLFANLAAREAFDIEAVSPSASGIQDLLSQASEAGYPDCLEGAGLSLEACPGGSCSSFIQAGSGKESGRRFEVIVNEVLVSDKLFAIAIARDSTERLLMEERIQKDLVEKETMLREIHHRVKNNFQLMKSLLALEASSIDDERARLPLLESENRIMSMAGAHERLYESPDLANVDAYGYFEDIVATIRVSFGSLFPEAEIEFSCERIALPLEIALPCGLILNELLSNCVKHAFPSGGREGRGDPLVSVSIGREAGAEGTTGCIEVSDNGVGIDESKLEGEPTTVGLMLIDALVLQLKGSSSWKAEGGTTTTIRFPLSLSRA